MIKRLIAVTIASFFYSAHSVAAEPPSLVTSPPINKTNTWLAERQRFINIILETVSVELNRFAASEAKRHSLLMALHHLNSDQLKELSHKTVSLLELEAAINSAVNTRIPQAEAALGDEINLVFTPINPCRIADSRSASAGKLSSNTTRSYYNHAATGQGGVVPCNTVGISSPGMRSGYRGALALTVTVTEPEAAGWIQLSPYGSATSTSVINFVAGQTIANSTVVQTAGAIGSPDIQLSTVARTHVILDLLGFYLPSEPAALDCINAMNSLVANVPVSGASTLTAASCPTGYTATATMCGSNQPALAISNNQLNSCKFSNLSSAAVSATVKTRVRCCRVAGTTNGRF